MYALKRTLEEWGMILSTTGRDYSALQLLLPNRGGVGSGGALLMFQCRFQLLT